MFLRLVFECNRLESHLFILRAHHFRAKLTAWRGKPAFEAKNRFKKACAGAQQLRILPDAYNGQLSNGLA